MCRTCVWHCSERDELKISSFFPSFASLSSSPSSIGFPFEGEGKWKKKYVDKWSKLRLQLFVYGPKLCFHSPLFLLIHFTPNQKKKNLIAFADKDGSEIFVFVFLLLSFTPQKTYLFSGLFSVCFSSLVPLPMSICCVFMNECFQI